MPTTDRPKILLVTRNFPPLTGGMERLMQKAAEGIAQYADLTIVGPKGCSAFAPESAEVEEVPIGLASFMLKGTLKTWRLCQSNDFDLVLGGSGVTAPTIGTVNHFFHIPTCLFIHGLDVVVDNFIYQKIFLPFIRRANLVVANSKNTRRLAIDRGVASEKITIINPGTELPELSSIMAREDFCRANAIPFRKIILFTGRITRRKGLSRFIEKSFPEILQRVSDLGLVVVGENPAQSLSKSGEAGEVRALSKHMGLDNKIRFLGQVDDNNLLAAYSAADVQIFPLVEVPGDVEGFGMIAIEAAAVGTPTVAFEQGGVADALATDGSCGRLVPPDDYQGFADAVVQILESPSDDHCQPCIDHAALYNWDRFSNQLESAIKKLRPMKS